ncbi:DNA recombination protein RmuC [Gordonia sp. (in: high G+C Gram-positive bacteria)]|uniref:DNA recombination protein RmuC n=1 Tax=Gordonia sp. (in: high G+C Gram-positive bacteria) TaxID=84139 RepID=UPI0016B6FA1C|nr:DNA recombination protein RmuC [Gordonia sp. (in: high G+C Gram-positive bacteria)]NLG48242.1 DNA recombination protein RmuC [Gordonia sp. (in: high G+C Gram-positive bacteria)]
MTPAAIIGPICLIVGALLGWLARGASLAAHAGTTAGPESGRVGAEVDLVVGPLRDTLGRLSEELRRSEAGRVHAYAGLAEQMRGVHATSRRLQQQTHQLAGALHAPQVRGRWGEVQLERVVELSGMSRHCDFSTQVHGQSEAERAVRPDLVVQLAGGRRIVVDAKVPLQSYMESTSAAVADNRELVVRHAQAVRAHVTALAGKSYWSAQPVSPEFVVLFLPNDGALESALRGDPELLDFAFSRDVVLATPSTLIALLRTVALGWRQFALAEDAETIHALGRQLYQRIDQVLGHLEKTGASLRRAVESYNSTVGAIDSRLGVTARKLADLEALSGPENRSPRVVEGVPNVDSVVRSMSRTL